MLHSKSKGNLGQFAVAKVLAQLGFSVFTEEGDLSKIDIIAEKYGRILRIQCKSIAPRKGAINVRFVKWGPNYKFKYTADLFDFFGVYDLKNDKVYFVPSSLLDSFSTGVSLRVVKAKNNQNISVRYCEDYLPEVILASYLAPGA